MATIVEYIVKLNTSQFTAGVKKMKTGFKGLNTSIQKMDSQISGLGVTIAAVAIVGLGAKLLKLGSDFEETNSKFATVFKDVSKESETTSKNLEKNFGLSSLASKTLLSDTGDLLTGFGFTGKMALGLSDEVQKLAVDLASFTNFSGGAKGASQALTKALLGERESVKSLGISILDADVKARVKQMEAMGKLTGMTMRQKKAFATLKIAQEQSKNAIGDYARTSDSFANTLRRLKATAENFGVFLGQTLVPIIQPFVNALLRMGEFATGNKEIFQDFLTILVPMIGTIGLIVLAIKAWVGIQSILNVVLAANPIGLVIIAISALIGVVVVVYRRSETFRRILSGVWEVMKLLKDILVSAIVPAFKTFYNTLKDIGTAIYDFLIKRLEGVIELFGKVWGWLKKMGGKVFGGSGGIVGGLVSESFKKGFNKDESISEDIAKSSTSMAGGVGTDAGTGGAVAGLTSGVKGKAASVTGAAPKIFNLNIEKLIETIQIKADNVRESSEEIQDIVLKAITGALADVQTVVR